MTQRGKAVIRPDVITRNYDRSKRQAMALYYVLEHGGMTIQNYEQLCPETNRRTLQRDLKAYDEQRIGGLGRGYQPADLPTQMGHNYELATNSRHNLRQTCDTTCDGESGDKKAIHSHRSPFQSLF